jgi:phospholipid/cholesterol/gamma-HCH transport system substrate-binding protein
MKLHYSHGMSYSRIEKLVGLFVLLPLIVVLILFWILARNAHLFEESLTLRTSFDQGHEIALGTPVVVSGLTVGQVVEAELAPGNKVALKLEIYEKYAPWIHADAKATLSRSAVFVGEKKVVIAPGSPDAPPVTDNMMLASEEPRELEEIVTQVRSVMDQVARTAQSIETAAAELPGVVRSSRAAVDNVNAATAKLPGLVDTVQLTVDNVERTTARLTGLPDRLNTTLDQLPPLVASVQRSLDNLEATTATAREAVDRLPGMMQQSADMLDDVNQIVDGAKQTWPIRNFIRSESPAPESGRGLRDAP